MLTTQCAVLTMQNLDFDFEKCCVVSLSPINVYACLVCGKYFQVSLCRQCQRSQQLNKGFTHH